MRPNQLKYFITLAEHLHYTRAAQVLGITQPTLSRLVDSMEEHIGVELFVKQGRNVILTDAGKIFLEASKDSLNILEEGIMNARAVASDMKGEISIGHMYTQASLYLEGCFQGFRDMYKDGLPKIHLNRSMSSEIIQGIQDDTYDVGFCFKPDKCEGVEFVPVRADELVIVVRKDHELSAFSEVNVSDIVEYPFVLYNNKSALHSIVREYFMGVKKYPDIIGTVKEVNTLVTLVKSGLGIGIVPLSAVKNDEELSVIRIASVPTDMTVYFAYANNKYLSPSVKQFVNYMKENHTLKL